MYDKNRNKMCQLVLKLPHLTQQHVSHDKILASLPRFVLWFQIQHNMWCTTWGSLDNKKMWWVFFSGTVKSDHYVKFPLQIVTRNVMANIIPLVVSAKHLFEKERSPLLKDLLLYLKELMQDYRNEISGKKFFIIQLKFLQKYFPISVLCNIIWYCVGLRAMWYSTYPSNHGVLLLAFKQWDTGYFVWEETRRCCGNG